MWLHTYDGYEKVESFWRETFSITYDRSTYENMSKFKSNVEFVDWRLKKFLDCSVLDELNEKVQFSSKVHFLVNFELNLVHFFPKELELNKSSVFLMNLNWTDHKFSVRFLHIMIKLKLDFLKKVRFFLPKVVHINDRCLQHFIFHTLPTKISKKMGSLHM